MGWAQRRKNRVDLHREHLLAEIREELEIELSTLSAVRGASPVTSDAEQDRPASVTSDAEQDRPASLAVQDPLDSPVGQDACGQEIQDSIVDQDSCGQDTPDSADVPDAYGRKRQRHVTVQDYPWKFVSPQLLDRNGQKLLYPVEDDRDRWWARKMECAIKQHRDLAERDLDGLQAYSLEIVRRVQQKMAKEKCCFCLAMNQYRNM